MKRFIIIAMLTAIMPLAAMAQHEEDTENGVVSLAGREGFTIETKKGDFHNQRWSLAVSFERIHILTG